MLRRAIFMRHAKSGWDDPAMDDHDRPLAPRGLRDAPRVAAALVARGWIPEQVLCSDAVRTRQTWERMAGAFSEAPPVAFSRALYHAHLGDVRRAAADVPDTVGTLLILGHNPGWEEAVGWLTAISVELKTGAAALIEGHGTSWGEALDGRWRLVELIRPRDLE
jgi:phosphohistidine phosphatase